VTNLFARFLADESGATVIEYSLIASLIAIAVVAGATGIGIRLNTMLSEAADKVPTVN
jgi:pilus assembly protein Flp/PilA